MLQEIISISRIAVRSCGYASQIMMMIEKVFGIEFLKDHEFTDLKPQFSAAPIITKDVPSTSAPQPPLSTRSGTVVPPLTRSSSSSSGGVLRVLKSMFAWCRDTHKHQDVLISNQRCLAGRMGVNEFPLLVPPLDDDPFTSLSTADRAAMEADDDDAEGGSGNKYEEEEKEEDDDDYDKRFASSSSFFSLFGALMPEGEKNIYLYPRCHFIWTTLVKPLIVFVLVMWSWSLKLLWCACKNFFYGLYEPYLIYVVSYIVMCLLSCISL
jgi:hypothetical protein